MKKVPDKLTIMLDIIGKHLEETHIDYALIGSLALGFYGLPRYTSDIDLLIRGDQWRLLVPVMKKLGYTCSYKTEAFAQFDSELGVYGRVDIILVETEAGRQMLQQSQVIEDRILGARTVLQPTDYVILKLMAIANSPERGPRDEADLISVLKLNHKKMIPAAFHPLDMSKIRRFAVKFRQEQTLDGCITTITKPGNGKENGEFRI